MKALKKENAAFTSRITAAIADCYAGSTEPVDAELMALYVEIGKCICEQGEKAYVVHLALTLAEQFPSYKGFSPRNLRRMRDFYRAYENAPLLMERALSLNWTQNTVILECCETDEQRAFYIRLAAERDLSKLALMKAIQSGAFEAAVAEPDASADAATVCAAVNDYPEAEAADTAAPEQAACGAFVPTCDPPRQGGGMPAEPRRNILAADPQIRGGRHDFLRAELTEAIKRSSHTARQRLPELLHERIGDIVWGKSRLWSGRRPPANDYPPGRWRRDFAADGGCFA